MLNLGAIKKIFIDCTSFKNIITQNTIKCYENITIFCINLFYFE